MKKLFILFLVSSSLYIASAAEVTVSTSGLVWADRDAHGCIGSAGYSWSEVKQQCVRPWEEEPMPVLYDTVSEEPMMCTMDYNPVCGVNGTTYGNACTAGKNPVAYKGECNTYVDNAAYAKLVSTKTEALKRQLSKYSNEKLLLGLENIEKAIKMVELSRIARSVQIERITLLTFIKNTVPNVLESRTTPHSTGKMHGTEDIAYTIEWKSVKFTNGKSETATLSGSASNTITTYLGNTSLGDLNGDGTLDVTFILTQETGGSGLFYYSAVALMTDKGYIGTNAVFLGDWITPISTEIKDGKVIVNYAERKAGEAMTIAPTIATSKTLKVSGNTLAEITK